MDMGKPATDCSDEPQTSVLTGVALEAWGVRTLSLTIHQHWSEEFWTHPLNQIQLADASWNIPTGIEITDLVIEALRPVDPKLSLSPLEVSSMEVHTTI